jgi:hypothetical protein
MTLDVVFGGNQVPSVGWPGIRWSPGSAHYNSALEEVERLLYAFRELG